MAPASSSSDLRWMRRALALARRGQGKTSPNPCVGAVIIRSGRVLGEGWHRAAGQPHAEVEAIQDSTRKGHVLRGATLYVTLEPCCTWGRTPPCTEAIVASGIKRVVVGVTDPNPRHDGKAYAWLKRRRVSVTYGVLEEACADLNREWNHWIATGRPWVTLKAGMTLDGKIATASGESRWITSETSRHEAHRLRAASDAILVGRKTIQQDDPELGVRLPGKDGRQPVRVVLDGKASVSPQARLFRQGTGGNIWIFTGPRASRTKSVRLEKAGARVIKLPLSQGKISLKPLLNGLGREGIIRLLVEGGGEILGSFVKGHLLNEVVLFMAPKVLGGLKSVKMSSGTGSNSWKSSIFLQKMKILRSGSDLKIHGLVQVFPKRFMDKPRESP